MRLWTERALLGVGAVCLACGLSAWVDAGVFQFVQGRRLDALTAALGAGGGHSGSARARRHGSGALDPPATPRDLIGRLEIPRIGLSAIVAEGVDAGTLRHAVGHVEASALPGEAGNVVLAGHRDSFFRRLEGVRKGDRVKVTTPGGTFAYEIDSTDIVAPERVDLLEPTAAPTLTLITCYPFNYVGPAPDRFVVRAHATD